MTIYLPTENWTEIFKWLEQPKQIQNISLVNYRFNAIMDANLAKKRDNGGTRMISDLSFSRKQWGHTKLCKPGTNVELPIAVVPPPEYIRFNRLYIHHFGDPVHAFFNLIRQWFQQGFLLMVKYRPSNEQLIHYIDYAKFRMFARQALIGHCFGLDSGETIVSYKPRQSIGQLLAEDFILTIPCIRGIAFDNKFMIRWLFTPTTNGTHRLWIIWDLPNGMKNRIVKEFTTNPGVAQRFIIIFGRLNYGRPPPMEETQNQLTQECLRHCPLMHAGNGRWFDCIVRQPIGEAAPNFHQIDRALLRLVIRGLPSNDRPTICLFDQLRE